MAGDRIAQALARIDAAADRIGAAASSRASGAKPGHADLASKYETLRNEVGSALAELDRLIGSLDG